MSSQALSAAMRSNFLGAVREKLLLIMLADSIGEGGRGACDYADAFTRAELNEETGFLLLNSMQTSGILRWLKHPEDDARIIFVVDYEHAVFGGAK